MGSAVIRSLPKREPKPGENPLRTGLINMLLGAASDPTSIEVGPLGMTKALKGIKGFHGTQKPYVYHKDVEPAVDALLEAKYGDRWMGKVRGDEYRDLRRKLVREETKKASFKHFDPELAGTGAGGDLYGRAIYISEHPNIAGNPGYKGEGGMVRVQNIPPQAKILDIHKRIPKGHIKEYIEKILQKNAANPAEYEEVLRKVNESVHTPEIKTFDDIFDSLTLDGGLEGKGMREELWGDIVTSLGYDGISYEAGRVMGLPPGVPEGTRNWAIYNYDIINKPRQVAIERGFKKAKEGK